MRTKLDQSSWKRKEHFEFFRNFSEPFYHLNMDIECTEGMKKVKSKGYSVFAWYLFNAMKASNAIEEFRYRMEGEEVYIYDIIHASPTVSRDDGTFGFAQIDFVDDLEIFQSDLAEEIKRVQALDDIFTTQKRPDVIHYSALPWFSFTGLSHPRNYGDGDSIPKISFGKIFKRVRGFHSFIFYSVLFTL
jgi:chloramphenicol O-acetyltransferase type A